MRPKALPNFSGSWKSARQIPPGALGITPASRRAGATLAPLIYVAKSGTFSSIFQKPDARRYRSYFCCRFDGNFVSLHYYVSMGRTPKKGTKKKSKF